MLPEISVSVKVAVLRHRQILLMSYDDGEFHYNLPGGKAKKGECLRETATRKVDEETGLRIAVRRLLFIVEYIPERWNGQFGDVQKTQFNFLADALDDRQPRFSEPRDPTQVGFEWVPLGQLPNRYLLPRVGRQLVDAVAAPLADALVDRW